MNIKRELRVLEFDKIREKLASFCVTPLGAERCLQLTPESDFDQVQPVPERGDALQSLSHRQCLRLPSQ